MRKLEFSLFQAVDSSILMYISIIMKLFNSSVGTTIKIYIFKNDIYINSVTVMVNFAIDTLSLLILFRLFLLSLWTSAHSD